MRLQPIAPHPKLKGHIEKIWLFETSGKMPSDDLKLVIPNGCIKLSIAVQNGIVATVDGTSFTARPHNISLTGLIDVPVVLDAQQDTPTQTIVIEFSPRGAYRFFKLKFEDINNRIESLTDILGAAAINLEDQVVCAKLLAKKLDLIQSFLLGQLSSSEEDPIFEYCLSSILTSNGRITVKELERKMGYSSRWINMKFRDRLGVSPKNFSSIVRFNQYYKAVANNNVQSFMRDRFYDFYYDQSHFLKEFKRFTGRSHAGFQNASNEFGKLFYKD